jgi:hypothetical protein
MQIMQNCRSLWLSACSMPRPTVEQPRSISFLVALLDSNGHQASVRQADQEAFAEVPRYAMSGSFL